MYKIDQNCAPERIWQIFRLPCFKLSTREVCGIDVRTVTVWYTYASAFIWTWGGQRVASCYIDLRRDVQLQQNMLEVEYPDMLDEIPEDRSDEVGPSWEERLSETASANLSNLGLTILFQNLGLFPRLLRRLTWCLSGQGGLGRVGQGSGSRTLCGQCSCLDAVGCLRDLHLPREGFFTLCMMAQLLDPETCLGTS